ncbi:hypothetical protein D3C84_1256160 [compost metagenome]
MASAEPPPPLAGRVSQTKPISTKNSIPEIQKISLAPSMAACWLMLRSITPIACAWLMPICIRWLSWSW